MKQDKRECGSCTKCCEGWLSGSAHGYKFFRGKPCHFKMTGGCSIYEDRPKDPCKTYECFWLQNYDVPAWMKPDEVNSIITFTEKNGIKYIALTEAGETLRSDVLGWCIQYCLNKGLNFKYMINGGFHYIGSQEFVSMMDAQSPNG